MGVPAQPAPPTAPLPDGPRPGDEAALREMQKVLVTSLSRGGSLDELTARLRDVALQARPQLAALLPGGPELQREQLRAALIWLVDNLDRPQLVAAGCGQLGGVLREYGVPPQQFQLLGAALAEALRAGMASGWRQEYDAAWRTTWRLAHRWIEHGAETAEYQPVLWSAVVVGHERRLADLAVIRLRPYLPYRFVPGQYTRVEVAQLPGSWRPYSLAGAPHPDNMLELHVRAKGAVGISGVLVHGTGVGDRVRLRGAAGDLTLNPASDRDLLLIAGDTGVAPMKALLTQLAVTGDPRSAVLFWGARTLGDLYDIEELDALAQSCRRATVVPVISDGDPGPYASGLVTDAVAAYGEWSAHEVFLAGPPAMVATTRQVLDGLGLAADLIHYDPAA